MTMDHAELDSRMALTPEKANEMTDRVLEFADTIAGQYQGGVCLCAAANYAFHLNVGLGVFIRMAIDAWMAAQLESRAAKLARGSS